MFYNGILDDGECSVDLEKHKGVIGEKNSFPNRVLGKSLREKRKGVSELERLGKVLNDISRKGEE